MSSNPERGGPDLILVVVLVLLLLVGSWSWSQKVFIKKVSRSTIFSELDLQIEYTYKFKNLCHLSEKVAYIHNLPKLICWRSTAYHTKFVYTSFLYSFNFFSEMFVLSFWKYEEKNQFQI
jgi:hypothetical protein